MDTIRVDIAYRPLRIGWVIRSGDFEAFRRAVRLSTSLWGGRYNPILFADKEGSSTEIADLFRVDLVWPVSDDSTTRAFPSKFPYLINPFFDRKEIFQGTSGEDARALALDFHNALAFIASKPEWGKIRSSGIRLYSWDESDPLADVFLMHFGQFANVEETGNDYRKMLQEAGGIEYPINSKLSLSPDVLDHPTIATMSRGGVRRHYSLSARMNDPGFFIGDATDIEDLVAYWNLRAADIQVLFVDTNYLERFTQLIPAWEDMVLERVARRDEWDRYIALWSRNSPTGVVNAFKTTNQYLHHTITDATWNGLNLRAPSMHLGTSSVLGVIGNNRGGISNVSFALGERSYCTDVRFYSQHLVASVDFVAGLYGDENQTLKPPYVPELNEFYARRMCFDHAKLRVEPGGRIGLIIDTADSDKSVNALSVSEIFERIFDLAGYKASVSGAGLILRQVLAQVEGLQGARVFKIPGVRRLLRKFGPTEAFTRKTARQLIAEPDPENPLARFDDHRNLFIESRSTDTQLTPGEVFGYLVEHGLFRIGAEVKCPACRMSTWIPLDALKQSLQCELCGHEHAITRQLADGEWSYRRSGVFGIQRNNQGAVPVALTFQQLDTQLGHTMSHSIYSPSLDFESKQNLGAKVGEIDLLWLVTGAKRNEIILGECKDRGPVPTEEFRTDVENLRRIGGSLPQRRFTVFFLLSKLAAFTEEEVALASTLNVSGQARTILLTDQELEPYDIFERLNQSGSRRWYAGSPEDLAQWTADRYFEQATPTGHPSS